MEKSRKAIAQINVLRSTETSNEKSEEYKKCINDILPDIEAFEICCKKRVNMGLIHTVKNYTSYNMIISGDPNRHLEKDEFQKLKNLYNEYLNSKKIYN